MADLLPLELELERRVRRQEDAKDFWDRYQAVKNLLSNEYYPWVQANVPFYTDHGGQHVKSVIRTAGSLLRSHLNQPLRKSQLSCLDVFLLLSGVIWHDVGMVYGRSGHQDVSRITEKVKDLAFGNPDIHRFVDEISLAHAGSNGLSIPQKREQCSTSNDTYTVFPRALAAIVRFGDEISENRSRISQALLRAGVPAQNQIYWEYANCISASEAEPRKERIRLSVSIQVDKVNREFECKDFPNRSRDGGKITLVEYVLCRLEKVNNERVYCGQEFQRLVRITHVVAYLTRVQGTKRLHGHDVRIILGDSGLHKRVYPDIRVFDDFFARHPTWSPGRVGIVQP